VLEDLRSEYEDRGNANAYVVLGAFLPGSRRELSYREAAERLGTTLDATKVAIHRLRGRYRDRLREMVAETVSAPEEIEEEVRFLFAALGGS